jgi:hypothetical protein
MGGRGSSLGKGNRPSITSSGSTGGGPAPAEPAVPATEQPRSEPEKDDIDRAAEAPEAPTAQQPDPSVEASPRTGTPEERIQAAYRQLAERSQQQVRFTDLHRLIGDDLSTSEINAAMLAMTKTGYVHISPDSDRRNLTQADHDVAIKIGREEKHFLSIESEYLDQAGRPDQGGGFSGGGPAQVEPAVSATEQPRPKPETDTPEKTRAKPDPAMPVPDGEPVQSTEDRIREAVAELTARGSNWAGILDIRQALADVDQDEVTRVLLDMAHNNPDIHLAPEANRKALRQEDHDAAVTFGGGEQQHLIAIQPVPDAGALGRVQAAGFADATNADLEAARLHHDTPSSTYDQIRAEQKRRAQQ